MGAECAKSVCSSASAQRWELVTWRRQGCTKEGRHQALATHEILQGQDGRPDMVSSVQWQHIGRHWCNTGRAPESK